MRTRDDNLSPDEMADAELSALAHNEIGGQKRTDAAIKKAKTNPLLQGLAEVDDLP